MKKTAVPSFRSLFLSVGLTGIYFILGKAGLEFASINPSVSAIWPPTGFAIAVLLLTGVRMWPVILVGSFFVNLTTSGMLLSSAGIAVGNSLEAIIAVWCINRFANGTKVFERPMDVVTFAFVSGIAAAISAAIGVGMLITTGLLQSSLAHQVWLTWWLGDLGGAIVFTPVLLMWYAHPRVSIRPLKALEFILLSFALIIICYIIFVREFPHPYLFILPLIWSAFRFELRETATLLTVVMMIATYATIQKTGPFITHTTSINEALQQLQIFMVIIGVTKLAVAAAVEDRKHTDQTLYTRERRFQALIEKNTDAVVLTDPGSVITYASPSTYTVLGYKPEEVLGRSGFSFIHSEDVEKAKKDLTDVVMKPKESIFGQYRMKHKDGRWIWIETIGRSLLFDPAVQAVVINFRDITERKELERAKDEFLMTAAHQLRSPLTAIRWNLESIIDPKTKLPPDVKEKLMRIFESNRLMVKSVNELLDIAHIIQGKLPNYPEKTDVVAVTSARISENADFARRQKIQVHLNSRLASVHATVDPKHLNGAIENILSNAIKYNTPGGSVTVDILRHPNAIEISVTDTGIGIPAGEQNKLFTKFYRTTTGRLTDAQGAGLGLFIVKSYVEGWGGTVTLKSPVADDHGTTVSITIPLKKEG